MWYFIIAGISILLGAGGCYLSLRNRLHTTQKIDTAIADENRKLRQEYNTTKNHLDTVQSQLAMAKENLNTVLNANEKVEQEIKDKNQLLEDTLNENLDRQAELLSASYQQQEEELKEYYLVIQQQMAEATQTKMQELQQAISNTSQTLADLKRKSDAAIDVFRHLEKIKQEELFYQLQLAPSDFEEIKQLHSIEHCLRDSTPLNKIIWKMYYEKAYTDLIGRVFGTKKNVTGIYRITDVESGRCYVGQAINIPERWRQHIKRGLGAETPTQNKLYPAMKQKGPENFRFELLEECTRAQLNEREDFWQDFYQAKEFGYSMK